jgi:hypothetical protein
MMYVKRVKRRKPMLVHARIELARVKPQQNLRKAENRTQRSIHTYTYAQPDEVAKQYTESTRSSGPNDRDGSPWPLAQ